MGYNAADVYYQPNQFGLEPVFELDLIEEQYEFEILVIWRDKQDGSLWYAQDGGCSCPSPFEDYTSRDMLNEFDLDAITGIIRSYADFEQHYSGISEAKADEAIQKVERLARG